MEGVSPSGRRQSVKVRPVVVPGCHGSRDAAEPDCTSGAQWRSEDGGQRPRLARTRVQIYKLDMEESNLSNAV